MIMRFDNKSKIQTNNINCFVCGCGGRLHMHHVFAGANRKKSDEDGMVVYLCPAHHNMSNAGVHFNHELDLKIKQQAEKVWIDCYTNKEDDWDSRVKEFINRYGKNYV